MTLGQGIEIGPFTFTILRLLVAIGVIRLALRGERLDKGMNRLDWLILAWSAWALITSIFKQNISDALVFRLGLVYNACGVYFLLRIFCQSIEDVSRLLRITAILLIPLAAEMLYEQTNSYNVFSLLGGVPEIPEMRHGRIRSSGPFFNAILAGTVGAVSLPMIISVGRKLAIAGTVASLSMILSSASSGPVASALFGIGALCMWRWRYNMRLVRWCAVLGYILLDLIMKAPAYYLIARVDLAGGSTGWHRARLIESAFEHINEWWFAGTEYTRHWMPTGLLWSPDHTDITNHYLQMGVVGGLPLMLLFIAILAMAFSFVGQVLRDASYLPLRSRFMLWAVGASLSAHAATSISISYFDQSFLFLYLPLAGIGSARSATAPEERSG